MGSGCSLIGRLCNDARVSSGATNEEAPRGCVLFVDDEPAVLNVGQRFLTMSGFEVIGAESAVVALQHFSERGDHIDVAILDVSMPDLSGPELLRRMRETHPNIQALMTSGYARRDLEGIEEPVAFLQKPYKLKQLVEAVHALLAGESVTETP
jgi:DNA-binding response OmpR family regulator